MRRLPAAALAALLSLAACSSGDAVPGSGSPTTSTSGSGPRSGPGSGPAGPTTTTAPFGQIVAYPVSSQLHIDGRVTYPQKPPVGGNHANIWQNCGYYSQPVAPELAVHSMEHGAVWITYRPNLSRAEVDVIRDLARSTPYVLASPWPDVTLPAPVVASAWGLQLKLESATGTQLLDFVNRFANGPQTPERGGACSGAIGSPE